MSGPPAGALAAAAWSAVDPLLDRAFGTRYSDPRLVGMRAHLVAGAAFGWAFDRLGGRGWKQGAAAALAENVALWPALIVVAPRWFGDGRAFARACVGHALFGALLGTLVSRR